LPTAAQNSPAPGLNLTAPTTFPARLDGPLLLVNMASLRRPALLAQRPALVPAPTLTVPLIAPVRLSAQVYAERTWLARRVLPTHNHSASLESSVGYVETPFAEEAGLRLASLAGGRLLFGPFYNFSQTENILLGLPGGGSLPAGSVSMQNHAGVTVPLADESYGLNLSIRLKRDPEPGPRIHLLRCMGWVLGARGCVSN